MARTRLTVSINLESLAPAQFLNYNFNSYCVFGDKCIAANEDGIFVLDQTQMDETSEDTRERIEAMYESGPTDFGIRAEKRVRKAALSLEATGTLELTVKVAEGTKDQIEVQKLPFFDDSRQHVVQVPIGRKLKGRYFSWAIKNVQGADFSVDEVEGFIDVLTRKPDNIGAN